MRCGLVASPGKYAPIRTALFGSAAMSEAAVAGIGVGIGCDARLETERDARARKRILRLWSEPVSVFNNAKS